jgi:hypothetical protein
MEVEAVVVASDSAVAAVVEAFSKVFSREVSSKVAAEAEVGSNKGFKCPWVMDKAVILI